MSRSYWEGSVRKAGNQLRITAQLVNAADGFHVWSETYDREMDNVFAIQDEIADSVVRAIQTTLLGADEGIILEPVAETSSEAFVLYLQGRYQCISEPGKVTRGRWSCLSKPSRSIPIMRRPTRGWRWHWFWATGEGEEPRVEAAIIRALELDTEKQKLSRPLACGGSFRAGRTRLAKHCRGRSTLIRTTPSRTPGSADPTPSPTLRNI